MAELAKESSGLCAAPTPGRGVHLLPDCNVYGSTHFKYSLLHSIFNPIFWIFRPILDDILTCFSVLAINIFISDSDIRKSFLSNTMKCTILFPTLIEENIDSASVQASYCIYPHRHKWRAHTEAFHEKHGFNLSVGTSIFKTCCCGINALNK